MNAIAGSKVDEIEIRWGGNVVRCANIAGPLHRQEIEHAEDRMESSKAERYQDAIGKMLFLWYHAIEISTQQWERDLDAQLVRSMASQSLKGDCDESVSPLSMVLYTLFYSQTYDIDRSHTWRI